MSFDENLINNPSKGMPRLLEIMRALRDPESGCPWDIEQNFKTIAPYTVEEAYEVADAIERENWEDLKNELGDLLLQTVYHTQMAEEDDLFNFNDVVNQISEKMIQRHPHVFGNENRNKTASQQIKDWETIKADERSKKNQRPNRCNNGGPEKPLSSVSRSALQPASTIGTTRSSRRTTRSPSRTSTGSSARTAPDAAPARPSASGVVPI